MRFLETLIPPPIVTAVAIACVWLANKNKFGHMQLQTPGWIIGLLISLAFLGMLLAVIEMVRLKTTVNPLKPSKSSALATQGIFKWSRNPIYLGDALLIFSVGLFYSNMVVVPALLGFVLYINKFQITPEERVLTAKFGQSFLDYQRLARRWI